MFLRGFFGCCFFLVFVWRSHFLLFSLPPSTEHKDNDHAATSWIVSHAACTPHRKNVCRAFWWSECSIPVLPHYFRYIFHFTRPTEMHTLEVPVVLLFFFPWKNPIPKYLKSTVINFTITQILKKKIIRPPTSQSSMEEIQLMWQPSQWRQPLLKRKHPIDNAEDISTFSSFSSVSTVGEQLFCIRPKILQPLTYLLWQRSDLLCLFRDYAVHSISELFLSRSLPSPILAPRDCCELRTSA